MAGSGTLHQCCPSTVHNPDGLGLPGALLSGLAQERVGKHPRLPVSVPLAQVLFLRNRVNVWQGDDVATVCTQPLLVQATFPVLQLVIFILVSDTAVRMVRVHAHAGHSRMVALEEVQVNLLITLEVFI